MINISLIGIEKVEMLKTESEKACYFFSKIHFYVKRKYEGH